MKIKICGIRTLEEINYINLLKPDYIGFVFAKSKRKITMEEAKNLILNLDKNIKSVGVFKNNSIEEVLRITSYLCLDVIQLHGDEDVNYINSLRKLIGCKTLIWKAILIGSDNKMEDYKNYKVDAVILDGIEAGSGQVFNWRLINTSDSKIKIFLAGGINEDNVLSGIEVVKPYGIDVSSGVEVIDEEFIRKKSFYKMDRLIRKVRDNYEG
ncbi:MAG: phosphoribosylanthranilate isomerase [Clostridium sp.]